MLTNNCCEKTENGEIIKFQSVANGNSGNGFSSRMFFCQ
ncbi:hypothetical protein KLPMMA171B_26310 [Klebsiella pneumoniae]|nr:Uncharacterised protein [Klebsiella pneumoniae]